MMSIKTPNDLTIGSIIEDYEFISAVIMGNRDIIDYDLYKLIYFKVFRKEYVDCKGLKLKYINLDLTFFGDKKFIHLILTVIFLKFLYQLMQEFSLYSKVCKKL